MSGMTGSASRPEDQDKIWQRFWQADASRGEDGGSGLGLAMVKEIAEFHGGRASVDSEPARAAPSWWRYEKSVPGKFPVRFSQLVKKVRAGLF